jgi:MscS family membrane protein
MSNDSFIVNETYQLFVNVEKFNDSSIDIFINTFTNTNDWEKFLKIREELVFIIKIAVETNNGSFAFPSQSIYIEKK